MAEMKKPVLLLVFLVIIAMNSPVNAQQPTLVVTDQVVQMDFHDQITLVGRTEAWIESRIVSEVAGRVQAINSGEGIQVDKGTPLVTIDADQIRFNLNAKEAEARQAKLEAELTQNDLKRAKDLYSKELVSESAYDSAVAWAGIKEQRFKQLEAERKMLELDLRNSVIKALYDGYTGRKLVDVGEWVNPGMPVFEMVDLSRIKVAVDLPERHFGRVSVGSEVKIVASGNGGEKLTGTVVGIAPRASEETHTFPVIIEVSNENVSLGGGMLVRTTLSMDETFQSLAVSKDAIIRQGQNTIVYTINEGKAAPIPVVTTSTEGKMVAVQGEGLSVGMPVVVRGNERIFPGSPVTTGQSQQTSATAEKGNQAN
ncbi:MAG: efflux RND transporter periplasmic adaptor subunit [candidate division Zixibacteria bacterium]|nr:efflux RND transporter periplasmic adaptor subunit [candidate division Zixibacteria bacterium]